MRAYLTLARRELAGYFASWTGYVIIAVVLLLLGLSFCDMLDKLNVEATDAPLTEQFFVSVYFWIILLLTPPIITMRTFALEKFAGTYETLMTSPVRDAEVVLAKFTGALLFFFLTWLPLLVHLLIVRRYSNDPAVLDVWNLLSTYLRILLVGAVFIALGCFASALSRSQIIAAMISYALGTGFFLLSMRSLVPQRLRGSMATVFDYLSVTEQMENFARGLVDTRPIVLCTSLTALFIFLTLKAVESRRWR